MSLAVTPVQLPLLCISEIMNCTHKARWMDSCLCLKKAIAFLREFNSCSIVGEKQYPLCFSLDVLTGEKTHFLFALYVAYFDIVEQAMSLFV